MSGAGAPIRLAVIGAGVMGRNYLRAAKAANIAIAFISDANEDSAAAAAAEFGCAVKTSPSPADMDAAVIAVPTAAHAAVAAPLLRAGVHCLVEKPFVAHEDEGRALIDAAVMTNAVLQVGHIERFNPAIEALMARRIDPATITSIAAHRMGPASARVTDVSVAVDLMIHDLDIVLALKPTPVTEVAAKGNRDHAEANLTFGDHTTASLTASRTSPDRVRTLDLQTADGAYHLDYIAKSLRTDGTGMPHTECYTGDALGAELRDFLACIAQRKAPRVSGETALAAMRLTWRIESALGIAS